MKSISERIDSLPLSSEEDELERVRDILVGAFQRETRQRTVELERRVEELGCALREELGLRLEETRREMHEEINALRAVLEGSLRAEESERVAAVTQLEGHLAESVGEARRSIEELERRHSREREKIEKNLEDAVNAACDELGGRIESFVREWTQRVEQLEGSKLDRGRLASLLTELASRLSETRS